MSNYEKGMEKVSKNDSSLGARSTFVLNNTIPAEALSGMASTGKFVGVSLSDTNPINQTAVNTDEGDKNE